MKVEQTVCNECNPPRIKGESNHWMQIGVLTMEDGKKQLTLGIVPDKPLPGFEIHDLCGQQCFHKHIDRLLGQLVEATPPPLPKVDPAGEAEAIAVNVWRDPSEVGYTGI
jgi:hypothetical protein